MLHELELGSIVAIKTKGGTLVVILKRLFRPHRPNNETFISYAVERNVAFHTRSYTMHYTVLCVESWHLFVGVLWKIAQKQVQTVT